MFSTCVNHHVIQYRNTSTGSCLCQCRRNEGWGVPNLKLLVQRTSQQSTMRSLVDSESLGYTVRTSDWSKWIVNVTCSMVSEWLSRPGTRDKIWQNGYWNNGAIYGSVQSQFHRISVCGTSDFMVRSSTTWRGRNHQKPRRIRRWW